MLKKFLYNLTHFVLIISIIIANCYLPVVKAADKTLGDLKKELEQFEKDYNDNKLQQELSEQEIKTIEGKISTINTIVYLIYFIFRIFNTSILSKIIN